ncbi:hypothetical protein Tco_1098473, partial [Tanacetum coccineum]
MFRMNILTLIANTLGSCDNNSTLKFTVLKNVFEGDDVSDIGWCSYILECASESKLDWSKTRKKKDVVYYGPMMFLMEYELIEEGIQSISIESECDDDEDDNSQVGDENDKSYGTQIDSIVEDHVQIVTEAQQEERNNLHYITTLMKKTMKKETGTSKKDEADNNNKEEMANKMATNQKTNAEFDPFDDPEFEKYFIENEHLFVPTQPRAEKKKDQTNNEHLENNSLQGSQPTFDLGGSPTYEKMKIISEKKKKRGLKSKYVNKTMDPSVPLTEYEKLLGRSLFSTQEEKEEEVFNDDERTILFRMNILSLAPRLEIDIQVIDAYVSI